MKELTPEEELEYAIQMIVDYHESYKHGGELPYPHWADEIVRRYFPVAS